MCEHQHKVTLPWTVSNFNLKVTNTTKKPLTRLLILLVKIDFLIVHLGTGVFI